MLGDRQGFEREFRMVSLLFICPQLKIWWASITLDPYWSILILIFNFIIKYSTFKKLTGIKGAALTP